MVKYTHCPSLDLSAVDQGYSTPWLEHRYRRAIQNMMPHTQLKPRVTDKPMRGRALNLSWVWVKITQDQCMSTIWRPNLLQSHTQNKYDNQWKQSSCQDTLLEQKDDYGCKSSIFFMHFQPHIKGEERKAVESPKGNKMPGAHRGLNPSYSHSAWTTQLVTDGLTHQRGT